MEKKKINEKKKLKKKTVPNPAVGGASVSISR